MKNPIFAGGILPPAFRVLVVLSLGIALTGCGKEGPGGSVPPPKKPAWSNSYDLNPLN